MLICATCAVERDEATTGVCPICTDEWQYVPEDGQEQEWLTLDGLAQEGQQTVLKENEPGLLGIKTEPKVGIGQTGQLVVTHEGSLLWDPVGYGDDSAVKAALERGPVPAIAASHPHMLVCRSNGRIGSVASPCLWPTQTGDGWGAMIRLSNTGPAVKRLPKG